jgi:alkylhydroperoxidase family enzyme
VTGEPGSSAGRLPPVPSDADDPALVGVFDVFRDAGRNVPVLYRTLANAPAMLQAWTGLAWPLRHEAKSDRGLRELLIMRVAQLTDASFEWLAHWDMAVKHGIREDQLAALSAWQNSDLFSDEQRYVLAMADELTTTLEVGEHTWERLATTFDAGELIELLLTVSFYSCVSRMLRALRLDVDVDPHDPRLASLHGRA